MSWIKNYEIYQISECQNKARKTLFIMSVSLRTYWTLPRRGLYEKRTNLRSAITEYATKLQQKNDMSKKYVIFFHFFYIFLRK